MKKYLLIFLVFLLISFIWQSKKGITGDEPHYLIYTQSILYDHDLDLKNNYQDKTYLAFYKQALEPHLNPNSQNNHQYSWHPIGLPLLILPGFWLADRNGTVLTILMFTVFIIFFLERNLHKITGKNTHKSFIALFLTLPFISYSTTIFTEMVAVFLFYFSLLQLIFIKELSKVKAILVGFSIGFLYILHYKYSLVIFFLILVGLFQLLKRKLPPNYLLFMVIPAVGCFIINSLIFNELYGNFLPRESLYPSQYFKMLFQGVPALLFDQSMGLFLYSPIFIFFPVGLYLIFKRSNFIGLILIALIAFILVFNGLNANRNAWAPAGRMIIILIPIFIYSVYILKDYFPRIFNILLVISLINTLAVILIPQTIYSTGEQNFLYWIYGHNTGINISELFPRLVGISDKFPQTAGWISLTYYSTVQTVTLTILFGLINLLVFQQIKQKIK